MVALRGRTALDSVIHVAVQHQASMDQIQSGWFSELNDLWAGQSLSLQVEKVLHHEKSKYQDILVFQRCVHIRVCDCLC